MRLSDPYSLRGGCTVVCRQTEPSRQRPSVPARRLWLWIDCSMKPTVVLLPPRIGNCRHDRRSYPVQRHHPQALCLTCLRGHAESRPFAGYASHRIAQTDEIAERHYRQASQRDVGVGRNQVLAGEKLRPFGAECSRVWEIRNYMEEDPVRAGLVRDAGDYRWSRRATGGSPADQGVRPTIDQLVK